MNGSEGDRAARVAEAARRFPGTVFWLGRRHGRRLEWLAGSAGAGSDAAAPFLYELGDGLVLAVAGTERVTADAVALIFKA